jgi:glyoxylase-like metal-dependent hydrolase (beta-lactamase superfamily II)
MKVDVLFQGFPGRMTRGYMSWSSIVYVEHAGHKILFDTGGMGERNELPKRFAEHGLKIDDIDILVLSHFHHDHVMNFDYFRNARILLHEKEAEWVLSNPDDWPTPKYLFPALQATGRLELISKDEEILPGIQTLLSPGHTPGCMSLVLRDKDMPTTVLAADAVKNITELATGQVGMSLNNAASAETIRKIREIAEIVIPGHDRILRVTPDKIIATTSCHEVITVPQGVLDVAAPKQIELVIQPTSMTIQ